MDITQQLKLLMQGTEYGDANLERSMEEELRGLLGQGRQLRVYCGYDPTSADLHLGHTISMRKLRQFQELGHEVTFLIGNYTALVGDPSDKDKTRPIISMETIEQNSKTYASQAFRILDPDRTRVRHNGEWLAGVNLEELLVMSQKFTVQQFLARENFAKRMKGGKPIYLHETLYALMQGYDAVAMEADVQVGGTDQLFNIVVAGRKLQQAMGQKPQVGIVLGILPGTDGRIKMSKSQGNYVPIGSNAEDMYGKIMSIPDFAMPAYWRLATRKTPTELADLELQLSQGKVHPRDAKASLAREITGIFWGREQTAVAEANFDSIFRSGGAPEGLPTYQIQKTASVIDVILTCGFAKSRGEARRLIEQGGVKLDGVRVGEGDSTLAIKDKATIQVGKRRFARVAIGGNQT